MSRTRKAFARSMAARPSGASAGAAAPCIVLEAEKDAYLNPVALVSYTKNYTVQLPEKGAD
jgi:hypothetical protein